jgi:hypothetical protein
MTLDQCVEKAATEIDAILQRRWDHLLLRLIDDGADPDESWIIHKLPGTEVSASISITLTVTFADDNGVQGSLTATTDTQ